MNKTINIIMKIIIIIISIIIMRTNISFQFLAALPKTLNSKLENVQVPALPDFPNPYSLCVCVCICLPATSSSYFTRVVVAMRHTMT